MSEVAVTKETCDQIAASVRDGASVERACKIAGVNHRTVQGGLLRAGQGRDTTGLYDSLNRQIEAAKARRKLDRLEPMIRDLKRKAELAA